MGIQEGENVQTNIDSQQKKSLSHKRKSTKNEDNIKKILSNDWNPFERADPSVLEKVMRASTKQKHEAYGEALL